MNGEHGFNKTGRVPCTIKIYYMVTLSNNGLFDFVRQHTRGLVTLYSHNYGRNDKKKTNYMIGKGLCSTVVQDENATKKLHCMQSR